MNYKKLIIDGYDGQQTTPLADYFYLEAQKAVERKEAKNHKSFFNGCKVVVSGWKRSITNWCDNRTKDIDNRINYWRNFIADDEQWENRVISLGGTVFDYNRQLHQKEKLENPEQKIQEYEQAKEQWRYELHGVPINTDDYSYHQEEIRKVFDDTPERPYITLEYNTLVALENALLQAEKELTPADTEPKNGLQQTIVIPENVLKWLQTTISKNGNGKAFVEKCNGKLKWLQNKQNARVLLTHKAIKGDLSDNKAIAQAPTIFIYGDNNEPLRLGSNDKRQENANTTDLRNYLNG
jgi:hypothetical protein